MKIRNQLKDFKALLDWNLGVVVSKFEGLRQVIIRAINKIPPPNQHFHLKLICILFYPIVVVLMKAVHWLLSPITWLLMDWICPDHCAKQVVECRETSFSWIVLFLLIYSIAMTGLFIHYVFEHLNKSTRGSKVRETVGK